MAVVVYQSGQKVDCTGWYEPVGVTRTLARPAAVAAPNVTKLEAGTDFPDWKGRAICWRLYAVDANDIPKRKTASTNVGD